MAVAVYRAIRDGGQALIQASTGIGKTMAALFPAIKTMGEGHIDRIFFLTARNTGKASALKALGILQEKGLRLKRVSLTAKDHICFCPDATCNPDVCAYAKGHFDRLPAALDEAFVTGQSGPQMPSRPWPTLTGSAPLNSPWNFPGGRIVSSATIITPSIPVYT
jgi:hypothetical protein